MYLCYSAIGNCQDIAALGTAEVHGMVALLEEVREAATHALGAEVVVHEVRAHGELAEGRDRLLCRVFR